MGNGIVSLARKSRFLCRSVNEGCLGCSDTRGPERLGFTTGGKTDSQASHWTPPHCFISCPHSCPLLKRSLEYARTYRRTFSRRLTLTPRRGSPWSSSRSEIIIPGYPFVQSRNLPGNPPFNRSCLASSNRMKASKRCSSAPDDRTNAAWAVSNGQECGPRPKMSGPKRPERTLGVRPESVELAARCMRRVKSSFRIVARFGETPRYSISNIIGS